MNYKTQNSEYSALSTQYSLNRYSSTSASGKIVRISKMEIIGKKRMNRNTNVRKNPNVPMNMLQSHGDGWYMPHDDGKKSRCKLVTTITKRSSHMPMLTTNESSHSISRLLRIFLIHKNWGVTILHRINAQ